MLVATQKYLTAPVAHSTIALIGTFNGGWLDRQLAAIFIPDELLQCDGFKFHLYNHFYSQRTVPAAKWQSVDVLKDCSLNSVEQELPTEHTFMNFSRTVIRALHFLQLQQQNIGNVIFNTNGFANVFRCYVCDKYINFFYEGGEWVVDASAGAITSCKAGDRFFFPSW